MARTKLSARQWVPRPPRATFPAIPVPINVHSVASSSSQLSASAGITDENPAPPSDSASTLDQEIPNPPSPLYEVEGILGHYKLNDEVHYMLDWGSTYDPTFENKGQLTHCQELLATYISTTQSTNITNLTLFCLPAILASRLSKSTVLHGAFESTRAWDRMESFLIKNRKIFSGMNQEFGFRSPITNILASLDFNGKTYYFVTWAKPRCGTWVSADRFATRSIILDFYHTLTHGFKIDELGFVNWPEITTIFRACKHQVPMVQVLLRSLGLLISGKSQIKPDMTFAVLNDPLSKPKSTHTNIEDSSIAPSTSPESPELSTERSKPTKRLSFLDKEKKPKSRKSCFAICTSSTTPLKISVSPIILPPLINIEDTALDLSIPMPAVQFVPPLKVTSGLDEPTGVSAPTGISVNQSILNPNTDAATLINCCFCPALFRGIVDYQDHLVKQYSKR